MYYEIKDVTLMNPYELEEYIYNTYGVIADYPWIRNPENAVFRHDSNQKWFALIMRISKQKLGIDENDYIDVVNLKYPMENISFILQENGVYPAYHMNRSHWITVALDGNASESLVKKLLSISFDLTVNKK